MYLEILEQTANVAVSKVIVMSYVPGGGTHILKMKHGNENTERKGKCLVSRSVYRLDVINAD